MSFETLHFGLNKPLLIIKGTQGFLACGYINVDTCNVTEDACAIVKGVSSFDDMKKATVVAVSVAAANLGIKVGDSGEQALNLLV
jgi:uncharacterized protein YunC (DUF1805 family)